MEALLVKNMAESCPFVVNELAAREAHVLFAIGAIALRIFTLAFRAQQSSVMLHVSMESRIAICAEA